MIEAKDMRERLLTRRPIVLTDAEAVTHGLLTQVQNLTYDEREVKSVATAARKATKPAIMKKIVTARSIGFTAINSSRTSNVKESEENSEEEALEELTTRRFKRLMKKNVNNFGPSQSNKKQKMTIERLVKPTSEAPATQSSLRIAGQLRHRVPSKNRITANCYLCSRQERRTFDKN